MEHLKTVINYMIYMGEGTFSPKQINRFLYYSYGIYLAIYNYNVNELENRLFDETFKTYPRGPIIEKANEYLEANRSYYFSYKEEFKDRTKKLKYTEAVLDKRSKRIIDAVLRVYSKYSGNELEAMVLKEEPYKKSKKGNKIRKIDDSVMFDYFAKQYKEDYVPIKKKRFTLFKKPKAI